jgi:hypothetical protein
MMVRIREARLDDTQAIGALFQAQIPVWQRINERGQVDSLSYEELTIYERWQHGGAWMSIETAAIHLSRLLRGAGIAVVGEVDGEVCVYAEVYPGDEPAPFGEHLHLAHLVTDKDHPNLADSMLRYLIQMALSTGSGQLTLSLTGADEDPYKPYRLQLLSSVQRYHLSARTGQGFYKVNDHPGSSHTQIEGWQMPIGRVESARQQWEMLWNPTWNILPEIQSRRIHRLHVSASGHEAFLCCQQQLYNPRSADLYCWSPKAPTAPLITAIRDWAHRQDYRTLALIVSPETAKVLGTEAEAEPFIRRVYAIHLS